MVGERVVFLDDYDLDSAARLVRGCDVWLNLPRPPLEASGTSGMKSVVQRRPAAERARRLVGRGVRRRQRLGALRRRRRRRARRRTPATGAELHRLLEREIVPLFAERDADGVPDRLARAGPQLDGRTSGRRSAPLGCWPTTAGTSTAGERPADTRWQRRARGGERGRRRRRSRRLRRRRRGTRRRRCGSASHTPASRCGSGSDHRRPCGSRSATTTTGPPPGRR